MSGRCRNPGTRPMLTLGAIQAAFPEVQILPHPIADSGQKHVFKATHAAGQVALKLIKPTSDSLERTKREIEAVAKLNCPYVPKIFSSGDRAIGSDVYLFLVEAFIQGLTFRQILQHSAKLSVPETVALLNQLLHACLDFEHLKIVHRDLKPENLMHDTSGKV